MIQMLLVSIVIGVFTNVIKCFGIVNRIGVLKCLITRGIREFDISYT